MTVPITAPIRIAIVGAGAITKNGHLPAILRSAAFELRALVDNKVENAHRLVRKYSLNPQIVVDNIDTVLDHVDALVIATPPPSHFALAEKALKRGVPVLVEKPFTVKYSEAVALCELAQQRNVPISVGYFTRHFPSVSLLKHLLESGFLGDVLSFDYQFGANGGWETVSGFNVSQTAAGGGVLIDTGTHFLDKMIYWFGPPNSTTYSDDSHGGPEANCRAQFLFANEYGQFHGSLLLSKTVALRNSLVVETERYICQMRDRQTQSVTVFPKDRPDLKFEVAARHAPETGQDPDYIQIQLEEFATVIRTGAVPTVDGWTAAQSVRLIEQMYVTRTKQYEPWCILERLSGREVQSAHA
jgi:predicted dehydrogenase